MHTVTLELLRHGPAHNQLLSPLTQYLALCENHGAVTLRVPFEHNQMLYRLRALSYESDEDDSHRVFQLKDTARVLGELLAQIPGLTADFGKKTDSGEPIAHFRLVISASELALLPFELAFSPNGFPGAGQSLFLQSQLPLSLTREVRRVRERHADLLTAPKILFAAASPEDVGPVPIESHLLALRQVINPWVKYYTNDEECAQKVAEHLVFLPRASADSLEEACATGHFTHVHLLAHGKKYAEGKEGDIRYGLALHNSRDPGGPCDIVNGERLATILRAFEKEDKNGMARPEVVTLASCHAGNVGSVAGAGASITHALHEAGIPIVIGSQFPLSFAASVMMVETLYGGLLWGIDPRTLMADLRRHLQARIPRTHDWASLVAYTSLPPDFEAQLSRVQIEQAKRNIDTAMNHADEATKREGSPTLSEDREILLKRANRKINEAKERLGKLRERFPDKKALICAQLASTEKRHAQVLFFQAELMLSSQEGNGRAKRQKLESKSQELLMESRELLNKSLDYYWMTFLLNRSNPWAMVQYLSLSFVLQRNKTEEGPEEVPARNRTAMWIAAHLLSQNDLQSETLEQRIWAHSNLLELYLLSFQLPDTARENDIPEGKAIEKALEHARDLVALAGRGHFSIYLTRRQVLRYFEWFYAVNQTLNPRMIRLARDIHAILLEGDPKLGTPIDSPATPST